MKRTVVHSCSYKVSKKAPSILEAWLGSCVGVALHDPEAGVGGMIHLLLPEPTGSDTPFNLATYASTGLPFFIQSLCDVGAVKEHLRACIAGGSLVAPVSDQDLYLDIGGRTAEVALNILNKEAIAIDRIEVGGYFNCRFSLNLTTWETIISPLWQPEARIAVHEIEGCLTPEEIKIAIRKVRPIPQLALQIIRMLHDEDYQVADIAAIVEQDQVISGRMLAMCNSAIAGMRTKVDSIQRAMVQLGEKKLLNMAISIALEDIFPASHLGYSLCKGGMFRHARGTALIAQELSLMSSKERPDVAYTAGLLHDIGKIPLDQFVASSFPYFYRDIYDNNMDSIGVEKKRFGCDHTLVGRELGERWALPENLIAVIKHHHSPAQAPDEHRDLVAITYLADLLMSRFQVGYDLERLNTEELALHLKRIGVKLSDFSTMIDLMPGKINELVSVQK